MGAHSPSPAVLTWFDMVSWLSRRNSLINMSHAAPGHVVWDRSEWIFIKLNVLTFEMNWVLKTSPKCRFGELTRPYAMIQITIRHDSCGKLYVCTVRWAERAAWALINIKQINRCQLTFKQRRRPRRTRQMDTRKITPCNGKQPAKPNDAFHTIETNGIDSFTQRMQIHPFTIWNGRETKTCIVLNGRWWSSKCERRLSYKL